MTEEFVGLSEGLGEGFGLGGIGATDPEDPLSVGPAGEVGSETS